MWKKSNFIKKPEGEFYMKKILILLLALFSLQSFSANYKVVKNSSVEISKQEIQKIISLLRWQLKKNMLGIVNQIC